MLLAIIVATTYFARPLAHMVQPIVAENWTEYRQGEAFPDGHVFGPWTARFNGLGKVSIVTDPLLGAALQLAPKAAASPSETHAALVTSRRSFGDFNATVTVLTTQQLRSPDPNAWEVAWVLWHYTDNQHFYYFILNRNGWELGKEDATTASGRRAFITGSYPLLALGKPNTIDISQNGTTISLKIDSKPIIQYADDEQPYLSGEVGLYSEDSDVRFGRIVIRP